VDAVEGSSELPVWLEVSQGFAAFVDKRWPCALSGKTHCCERVCVDAVESSCGLCVWLEVSQDCVRCF
jgi:hypothetical protein